MSNENVRERDPRKQVLVQRVLSASPYELYFPGHREVLEFNLSLAPGGPVLPRKAPMHRVPSSEAPPPSSADDFTRTQRFTPPRSLTLDTRLEGAVNVNVWTGYAVLVVSRTGTRRVVVGPATVTLEFDEALEAMELSTARPRATSN